MVENLEAFRLSIDEINYFVAASVVLAAAFTASRNSLTLETFGFYLLASVLILLTREVGQRTVAHWMEATVNMELSMEGTAMTVLGAIIAVVTKTPILLLVPVTNSFSLESYEHWGKDIDAMWAKRMAWIASGGAVAMLLAWAIGFSHGFTQFSEAMSLFLVFQLLPFDYPMIPTGQLDGSYILRQSDFIWMILFGLALLSLALV